MPYTYNVYKIQRKVKSKNTMRICSLSVPRLKDEWNQTDWSVNNLRCGTAASLLERSDGSDNRSVWGAVRLGRGMFWRCAQGVQAKSAATKGDGNTRKAGEGEARKSGAGRERSKCAVEVAEVVNPAIVDLESKETATGAKDAEDFGEGEILHFARLEMVEDKNGNGGRESLAGEG
jgi:hypothetical protein